MFIYCPKGGLYRLTSFCKMQKRKDFSQFFPKIVLQPNFLQNLIEKCNEEIIIILLLLN